MSRHEALLETLRGLADPAGVAGQARFGITGANRLGIRVTDLRRIARAHRRDHALAAELWASGIHEARILATLVDDPRLVTERQMERWLRDFDSWDIVDAACGNLFDQTPYAWEKALEWSEREPEFEKRSGFSLMAYLAVHDKKARDAAFKPFLKPSRARRTTTATSSARPSTGPCGRSGSAMLRSTQPRSRRRR